MKFDRSRVYSAVNADELLAGDKVIVADTLIDLKGLVCDYKNIETLSLILDEDEKDRFCIDNSSYSLAYLVEREERCINCKLFPCNDEIEKRDVDLKIYSCCGFEPKTEQKAEPHYRPFRDTDELIEEWDKKLGYRDPTGFAKPYIWVRRKTDLKNCAHLVTDFNCIGVTVQGQGYAMSGLFANFEFLDGSPCGVEE